MKKILFLTQNMKMNGANKSLINILNVIDKKKYAIDLFAFSKEGILADCIPKDINLLEEDKYMACFTNSMQEVYQSADFIGKGIRVLSAVEKKITGCPTDPKIKFLLWKFAKNIHFKYDIAIAWNEGACHKFLVDKIDAKIKIGWCHIDDEAWPYHYKLQKKYFPKLDYICTVSERCKKALLSRYDISEKKIKVIRNIMPIYSMMELSKDSFDLFDGEQINILTITRNEFLKKNSDAIQAAKLLHDNGLNIHWWILGGGFSEEQYNTESTYLTFVRPVKNPYVFIKNCDIYVQTSYPGEAWGMGVNEAKIFGKPVVVSQTEVFAEQVIAYKTGLIYNHTVDDLVEKIKLLIYSEGLKSSIQKNLIASDWSNIEYLDTLYSLMEGYE